MSVQINDSDLASVMSEERWQQLRGMGIGGSEVGALLGVDQYATPYAIWERKTGRADNFEGNDYTKAGHLLEPVIKQWFMEQTGKKIYDVPHLVSPTHSWRRVTPDGLVDEDGLMDAKNSRFEIPPDDIREGKNMKWMFQITWGLGIWNELHPDKPRTNGYIVWLGAGYQFQYLKFEYDPEIYEMMCEVVDKFWNDHVLADRPPAPINRDDILRAIGKVIPKAKEATEEEATFFQELINAKAKIKEWESVANEMQEALQLFLLDHDTLTIKGLPVATWKESDSNRIDVKALKAAMPDIAAKFTTASKTRTFRTK